MSTRDYLNTAALQGRKIGVVTPYDSNNYGAYLQAYATKCVLERAGADVAYLEFRGEAQRKRLFYRDKPGKREYLNLRKFREGRELGRRKLDVFSRAWGRFNAEKKVPFFQRDAFVLGSDEIWNVKHAVFRDNPVFFGYGLRGAVSYAPSVGKSTADDIKASPRSCEGMAGLSHILVRDEASADAVEAIVGERPDIVLDPTLLLDWDDYALAGNLPTEPYVLVYAYGEKNLPTDQIREFAKAKSLRLVSVGFDLGFCDECLLPDPLEFYSLMRGAEYVVTTTFHGSIFALLSHSKFLTFPTSQKTDYLLKTFDMGARKPAGGAYATQTDFAAALEAPIDYEAFEGRRAELRDRSVGLLLDGLGKALVARRERGHGGIDAVVSAGLCAGCGACRSSCAKGAITMAEGPDGALLPSVDESKCVSCGMCDKACPVNAGVELSAPIKCYAAWMEGDARDPRSSSGGIGHALAARCVEEGGTAFGAAVEGAEVRHVAVDSPEETRKLCGSKYVQSNLGNTFQEVRVLLRAGEKVLFSGTPCQVAGLKSFLGKDWPNLITADLVCHGTPPQRLLREHIASIVGDLDSVTEISFRTGNAFRLTIERENEVIYSVDQYHDSYYHCFMKCLDYRDSCYACPYARAERAGDLTLGDFWGLDRTTLAKPFDGRVSVVLVNSEKGAEALGAIECLHAEERELAEAVAGNPQLRRPSFSTKESKEFMALLGKMGFDEAFEASGAKKRLAAANFRGSKVFAPLRTVKKLVLGRRK